MILIDDDLEEALMADALRAKDSLRSRALVKGHLQKVQASNIYMVQTLDQMLAHSIELHAIHTSMDRLQAIRA